MDDDKQLTWQKFKDYIANPKGDNPFSSNSPLNPAVMYGSAKDAFDTATAKQMDLTKDKSATEGIANVLGDVINPINLVGVGEGLEGVNALSKTANPKAVANAFALEDELAGTKLLPSKNAKKLGPQDWSKIESDTAKAAQDQKDKVAAWNDYLKSQDKKRIDEMITKGKETGEVTEPMIDLKKANP